MEICTSSSTRGTTLLSRVVLSQQPAGVVRPQTAPTTRITASAVAEATRWRGGVRVDDLTAQPFAAVTQGGAVAITGAAPVTDLAVIDPMVTDHPYSTRLEPFPCRPPV